MIFRVQHMDYVIAAANLRASVYGVAKPENNRDPALMKSMLATVTVPEFVPKVSAADSPVCLSSLCSRRSCNVLDRTE